MPAGGHAKDDVEEVTGSLGYEQVLGFEASASNCINRARQIARSLNHATLSSDHLMLALTMDQGARRLLERAGDVDQLRATAMRKLGKNYNKAGTAEEAPSITADLADLGKKALAAAGEREQMVSISDLIAAFPKANGVLSYGAGENSQAIAVIDKLEKQVIPGVNDAVTRIENAVVDAVQRHHQSIHSILQDLNSRQAADWQRQQREFMDEVRRQVREASDMQFSAALRELNEAFERKLGELTVQLETSSKSTLVDEGSGRGVDTSGASTTPRRSPWPWSIIL